MSRAFVRESDGDDSDTGLPERPESPNVNYVTCTGLALLKEQIEELEQEARSLRQSTELGARQRLAYLERDLRYFRRRFNSAVLVDRSVQAHDRVVFGSTVVLADEDDARMTFTIVGEDEADAAAGKISWVSPLAKSLLNAQAGDVVTWNRPSGPVELEVVEIVREKTG
ncbi:MAG: GreA/GreB family elongation factor [Pseudomonadota bacterium]